MNVRGRARPALAPPPSVLYCASTSVSALQASYTSNEVLYLTGESPNYLLTLLGYGEWNDNGNGESTVERGDGGIGYERDKERG